MRQLAVLSAAAIASLTSTTVRAQVNDTWIGPIGGSWNVGSFWTSNPDFPSNGGTANFAAVGPHTAVVNAGTISLSALRFDSVAQVDIALGSFNSTFSFSAPGIIEVAEYKQNKPGDPSEGDTFNARNL